MILAHLRLFSSVDLLSYLTKAMQKWTSWPMTCNAEGGRYSLCFHFPLWKMCGLAGVSWHWDVLLCRKNFMVTVKLFLPSSLNLFLGSLLKWGSGISPLYFRLLTKVCTCMKNCQNWCFCGGVRAEISYSTIFHHFADITLQGYF